jgi:acyl-CoA synthetase (NDP forming)
MDLSAYEPLFYPRTLAVIGASDSFMKFGGMFLRTILNHGYTGKIYPVNPKGGTIQGLTAYPSIEALPGPVDLAVVTVPAAQTLAAAAACGRKGVRGLEVLTAGFREIGPEGAALERELVEIARSCGMRVIGPNGFGVYTPAVGLTLMPGVDFSRESGPVGFISQSGGGACDVAYMGAGRGVRFSTMVSYGNGADLEAAELLRYFEADPRTEVVGAYLEGVRDGREFFAALKSCAARKPVVVLKGGRGEMGNRGTMGHTGSLAGTQSGWKAALASAGATAAEDGPDLVDCLMAFCCLPGFRGEGAGVLSGGGLRCVEALDWASAYGFTAPLLRPETEARIRALLPPAGSRSGNPVDLANPVMAPQVIVPAMGALAEEPEIDFLVLYQMLFYLGNETRRMGGVRLEYHSRLAAAAVELRRRTGKPLIAVLPEIGSDPALWESERGRIEARAHYTRNGIPCFAGSRAAFSTLRRVADYYRGREARSREQGERGKE